jgi:hypothetical protein
MSRWFGAGNDGLMNDLGMRPVQGVSVSVARWEGSDNMEASFLVSTDRHLL